MFVSGFEDPLDYPLVCDGQITCSFQSLPFSDDICLESFDICLLSSSLLCLSFYTSSCFIRPPGSSFPGSASSQFSEGRTFTPQTQHLSLVGDCYLGHFCHLEQPFDIQHWAHGGLVLLQRLLNLLLRFTSFAFIFSGARFDIRCTHSRRSRID